MRLTKLVLITLTLGMFVFAGACGKKDDDKKKGGDKPKAGEKAPAADKKADDKPAAAKEAPAGDMTKEQMGEKMMGIFQKMTDAAKNNADNCDNMATELTKVITEAKPLMAQAEAMEKADPGSKEWFEKEYGEKMGKMMGEMMGAMAKCQEHEGVMKAMEGLE